MHSLPTPSKGENQSLIKAIMKVSMQDTPQTRQALYEVLSKSTFLVPTAAHPQSLQTGNQILQQDTPVQLVTTQNAQGKPSFLVFTDEKSLLTWKPQGSAYVAMEASNFFPIALENNVASILVNPAGPIGGEITRQEIEFLAEKGMLLSKGDSGGDSIQLSQGNKIFVRALPKVPPEKMVFEIHNTLVNLPTAAAAYLFQMAIEGGKPHLALGLTFSPPPSKPLVQKLFQNLGEKIHPFLKKDTYIDFLILEGELLESVQAIVEPIFLNS
jgi:hypothetical protein